MNSQNTVDPYKKGMFKKNPYAKKTEIKGELVVVLEGSLEQRGLELIKPISRCVKRNDVHELIFTTEDAKPGDTVNKIAYLGFFEVENGGVIVSGDKVYLNSQPIGEIRGFDYTHMPNHLNIVIHSAELKDGFSRGCELGDKIVIKREK